MELLTPLAELGDFMNAFPKADQESGQPQVLQDNVQAMAKMLGRQNVSYDHVWEAAEKCYPNWLPVHCETYRRAILLAGSAIQHRTKMFDVWRRGRLVCVRLIPSEKQLAQVG